MKVKYKIQDILQYKKKGLFPNEELYYSGWKVLPKKFHLTYGENYTVYGIEFTEKGFINLLIKDDTGVIYPKFYPLEFFEIIDSRISKYFTSKAENLSLIKNVKYPFLVSFREAVYNDYFFDDLLNSNKQAVEIFNKYKNMIDREYIDHKYPKGISLDYNWFSCYYCKESWEVKNDFEILECPNCKNLQNRR